MSARCLIRFVVRIVAAMVLLPMTPSIGMPARRRSWLAAVMLAGVLAGGGAAAAKMVVQAEFLSEFPPPGAEALCPLMRRTLEAFAASAAARRPVCDWRPLHYALADGLTLPEWKPAGSYVRADGFVRRFLAEWLDVLVKNGGKPLDQQWRDAGYARVLGDPRAALSWQEATFVVSGDRRARRWLRLDIADCSRYPETFVGYVTLPKLAAITGSDDPALIDGQMLGSAFSSDDVFLYDGSAYDLYMVKLPYENGASLTVAPMRLAQLNLPSYERTLITGEPFCRFRVRPRR